MNVKAPAASTSWWAGSEGRKQDHKAAVQGVMGEWDKTWPEKEPGLDHAACGGVWICLQCEKDWSVLRGAVI